METPQISKFNNQNIHNDQLRRQQKMGKFCDKISPVINALAEKREINVVKSNVCVEFRILMKHSNEDSDTVLGKGRFNVLHYACHYGHYEIIKYLLNDLDLKMLLSKDRNEFGETPVDALRNSQVNEQVRKECLKLFEDVLEKDETEKKEEFNEEEEKLSQTFDEKMTMDNNLEPKMENGEETTSCVENEEKELEEQQVVKECSVIRDHNNE
nr:unnamed protein product [Naegleria fowleri]